MRLVCVARASGRLGNQLTQYLALRSAIGPDGRLLLLRFGALRSACDGVDATYLPGGLSASRVYTAGLALAGRSSIRSIDTVSEEDGLPVIPPDARLVLTEEVYLQHGRSLEAQDLRGLRPRAEHLAAAGEILTRTLRRGEEPVFIQIRLGDYLRWGPAGHPAVAREDWLRDRATELLDAGPRRRLFLISDDPDAALDILAGIPVVSDHRPVETDLALMSRCTAGALSPSTLAWWGARFAVALHEAPGPFFAPMWWAGHRMGAWHPPHAEAGFLTYR